MGERYCDSHMILPVVENLLLKNQIWPVRFRRRIIRRPEFAAITTLLDLNSLAALHVQDRADREGEGNVNIQDQPQAVCGPGLFRDECSYVGNDPPLPIVFIADIPTIEIRYEIKHIIAPVFQIIDRVHERTDSEPQHVTTNPAGNQKALTSAELVERRPVEFYTSLCMKFGSQVIIVKADFIVRDGKHSDTSETVVELFP